MARKKSPAVLIAGLLVILVVGVSLRHLMTEPSYDDNTRFVLITGEKIPFSALQGKPSVITFWATTCPACFEEMPMFRQIYKEREQHDLNFMSVAMYYDPPDRVVQHVKKFDINYPVSLDLNATVSRAFGRVLATPTTLVLNPEGRIVKTHLGKIDRDTLLNLVEQARNS